MRRSFGQYGPSLWVVLCLTVSHIGTTQAQINGCSKDTSIGELVSVENSVEIVSSINSQSRNFTKTVSTSTPPENRYICEGDEIIVGPNSRASLFMTEPKSVLRLDENSIFQVKSTNAPDYGRTPNQTVKPALTSLVDAIEFCHETINRTWLNLKQGALHIFTTQPQQLNINTPYMNASVEGTEFVVRVDSNQAEVSVIDGVVGVCNNEGNEVLTKGQRAAAQENAAPERVDPVNAVQWALYYPILGTNESTTQKALDAYELANKGQSADAIRTLNATTNDAYSLALRSTIAVANNQLDDAQTIAKQAIAVNEDSPSAWMAKSYVEQANFDLPQAQLSVEKANELNPNDAIILARLAELRLSNDDKKGAQDAAEKAKAANPDISRTQTVLGFLQLSQFDIDDAKESFSSAIDLDEADPLPRLGLGLANIRKNHIEDGKKNIEIAVSLDPGNSLLRSYLGKTYFENNDDNQAAEQLALAEGFDSKDPTPSLYSAFVNQSNNRPTQALKDLQKSIEKNDNRAVYRSRFGLDEDLATRSASAARIYDELGFDQLTVLEGAKSLAQDPGNYSAHRLMADAYLNRPRHEIARVSELLQSQIRQPLNNNPAQVQLSDSRLGAFRDSGPFDVSFNEFSRLYTKEGISGRVGLVAGENSTVGGEIQASILTGNNLFTVTAYDFETDGNRQNIDEDNELFNFFVQRQLTDRTSLQAEYRNIDINRGETYVGFDREDFDPNLRVNLKAPSYRLSAHHFIDTEQEVLFNYKKEKLDSEITNIDAPEFEFTRTADRPNEQLEVQYIRSKSRYKLITGIGRFDEDFEDRAFTEEFDLFDSKTKIKHRNYYGYFYPTLGDFEFTIGASYDDFKGDVTDTNNLNPKIGLVFTASKNTTLRLAGIETFKRSLVSDQTLEPTNIAGFNQFFDDPTGAEAKVYGLGVDHKINLDKAGFSKIHLGIEGVKRQIDVPVSVDFLDFEIARIGERNIRAYAYLPYKNWSIGLDLENEVFDRQLFFEGPEQIVDLRTKRARFNISYFNSNGFSFSIMPTFIDQKASMINRFFLEYSGEDNFWVFDALVRYQVPDWLLPSNSNGEFFLNLKNIFDKEISYQDTDPFDSRFESERVVFIGVNLSF